MKPIFTLFLLLTLFSCKKDSVNNFAGTWIGTYTGTEDNGTFSLQISNEGKVTGTATSVVALDTYQVVGAVATNGTITVTFGTATSGGTFIGTLKGNTGSGTWENKMTNPTFTGTWTGSKQ